MQSSIVGSAGEAALKEAFNFYQEVKRQAQSAAIDLTNATVLDFGVGWGRYSRMFAREVDRARLFGVDVMNSMVDVCRVTKVPASICLTSPTGTLPFKDGFFDIAFAYSVFTHLPQHMHQHWITELARVTKAGGIIVLTIEPRRFIEFCRKVSGDTSNPWYATLSRHMEQVPNAEALFDSGQFVYLPSGGGDELPPETYGDAVIPLSYLKKAWGNWFTIVDYLDDASRFWQAVVTAKRKPS